MRHQTNLYLQIGCEGIREPHVPWEGTEDEVAELDAVGRNDITEAVMIVAQELWEVMQQNQKHSQCTLEPKKKHNCDSKENTRNQGELLTLWQPCRVCVRQILPKAMYKSNNVVIYLIEDLHRFVQLYIPQERCQVLEEINQQLCVHGPTLPDNTESRKTRFKHGEAEV